MTWNLTYHTDPKSVGTPDRGTAAKAIIEAAYLKEFFLDAASCAGENIPDGAWDFCHYRSDSEEWFEVHLLKEAGNWNQYRHLGQVTIKGSSASRELRKQAEIAVYNYIQHEHCCEYQQTLRDAEALSQRVARNEARDSFLEANKSLVGK